MLKDARFLQVRRRPCLGFYPWNVATTSDGPLAAARPPCSSPLLPGPGQAISRPRSPQERDFFLGCNEELSVGGGPPSCRRAAPPLPRPPRRPRRCCRWRQQGQLGVPGGCRLPASLPPDLLQTQVGNPHHRSIARLSCLYAISISSKTHEMSDWRSMVLVRSRVFLYQHFLSDDEANHLISLVSATLPPHNPTERLSLLLDNARTRLNFGYCSFSSFQARAELKRSAVADNMSGKSTLSEVRTSSGTFLRKGQVRPFLLSLFG